MPDLCILRALVSLYICDVHFATQATKVNFKLWKLIRLCLRLTAFVQLLHDASDLVQNDGDWWKLPPCTTLSSAGVVSHHTLSSQHQQPSPTRATPYLHFVLSALWPWPTTQQPTRPKPDQPNMCMPGIIHQLVLVLAPPSNVATTSLRALLGGLILN